MASPPQIILVNDDQALRRSLQLLLRGHGYRVRAYADARSLVDDPEALSALLLVADYRMPQSNGFDVLRALRKEGWAGSAVLITGFGSPQLIEDAKSEGFDAILDKPVRPNLLLGAAHDATVRARAS